MPTLKLTDGKSITLTPAKNGYYTLGKYEVDYIADNQQLEANGKVVTVRDKSYDRQLSQYLDGKLVLARGITRHHPLWYEARWMGIVAPLGVGDLPDWATNATSYIPFGPPDGAMGIAIARKGMGPGDDQQALADLETIREQGKYDAGLIATVTVKPGMGVAFYNSGEIQVKGPLYRKLKIDPLPTKDEPPSKMSSKQLETYVSTHGGLRHCRTVKAIAKYGLDALLEIQTNEELREQHAMALYEMRLKLVQTTGVMLDSILTGVPQDLRPGKRDNDDYRAYLDSSSNREAHDAYIAAVVGGEKISDAVARGANSGREWVFHVYEVMQKSKSLVAAPFKSGWSTS